MATSRSIRPIQHKLVAVCLKSLKKMELGCSLTWLRYAFYYDAIAYDRKRQRAIEEMGWHVIRFGGKKVFVNASACVAEARKLLEKRIAQMNALLPTRHSRFTPGDKVRHSTFGEGVVIKGEEVE